MNATPLPISATVEMAATPDEVWKIVSDVRRMPQFSPELQKVILVGNAGGAGQRLIGLNKRKWLWWPTTSKVIRFEPNREIAWHTRESGATWTYRIEPTATGSSVTARRDLPGFTLGSKALTPLMGGAVNHDRELADGLRETLLRIKAVLEG